MNMNPYIYLFGGLSLTSPLVFAFFSLDYNNSKAFWITFSVYSILYTLGIFMFNYLQTGSAFKFEPRRRWEITQENKVMIETKFNTLWGLGTVERKVIADVYRKKRRNGTYKYKTIPKH